MRSAGPSPTGSAPRSALDPEPVPSPSTERGVVTGSSKQAYLDVIDRLLARGATGVIAGCTEIELLVRPGDVAVPYFPTARLHAEAAVTAALGAEPA